MKKNFDWIMPKRKKEFSYKPHLPNDKNYLSNVAKIIKKRNNTEEIRFDYLTEFLDSISLGSPYPLISLDNLRTDSLQNLVLQSFEKINSAKLTEGDKDRLFRLWDYLAEADALEPAELIFVFGGPGTHRVDEAVKLWKEGLGSKILFTGHKASYMKDIDMTEAEYYAEIAIKKGVPENNLILETAAKNTPENVVNSILKLKQISFLPEKIILITLAFHMRRSYLTFKSAAEWNPILIRHPVVFSKHSRENYFKDFEEWSYVFFEYVKMYGARLMGHF